MRWGQEQEHSPCWALSLGLGMRPGHQCSLTQGELPLLLMLLSSLGHQAEPPRGVWLASIPPAA